MTSAATGSRLIGHARHPFDQILCEETIEGHQHQADGAIATYKIPDAGGDAPINDVSVDGIEDDYAVVVHPFCACRVDPISPPTLFTELGQDLLCVIAPPDRRRLPDAARE